MSDEPQKERTQSDWNPTISSQWIVPIGDVCTAFVQAWQGGRQPKIEDHLGQLPIEARDFLLLELIREELLVLRKAGRAAERAEYEKRFPGKEVIVERAFALAKASFQEAESNTITHISDPAEAPTAAHYPAKHAESPAKQESRYRMIRLHARGGLGEVFLAKDQELNREVALKEIQDRFADTEESRIRFRMEAEITGNLEHPGIVPVYGLGQYADGRPYYAMRFVRGESLKEAIDDFHLQLQKGAIQDLVGLELRQLLRRFVDVCNAMEYAHSRGILHRDLKPGNIILGKYGETLVVDWGLAKAQGEAETTANSITAVVPASRGDSTPTVMGSALGTPAYMSPEQAAGRIDILGPATDVYSLGATLFQLLTGEPPIVGRTALEVIQKAAAGDIRSSREVNGNIPKSLDAVCRQAMSQEPSHRYASPRHLADEIERWLADEPVLAYREPALVRLKRWIRRHPALVSTSVVATSLGLAGALVIAYLNGQHAQEVELKNQALASQNAKIQEQKQNLETKNTELLVAKERAETSEKKAIGEQSKAESVTDFLVASFRKLDPNQDGKSLTVYDSLLRAKQEIETSNSLSTVNKASILSAMYQSFRQLGMFEESFACAESADDLAEQLFEENSANRLKSLNNLATAYRELGKMDLALPMAKDTYTKSLETYGEDDDLTINFRNTLGTFYLDSGKYKLALPLLQANWEARKQRLGSDHELTLAAQNNLACCLDALGNRKDAIPLFESTLEGRRRVLGEDHSLTLMTQDNLSLAYADVGKMEEAKGLAESTFQQRTAKLGAEHPETLRSKINLATIYLDLDQFDLAIPLLEEANEINVRKYGDEHPDTILGLNNLAEAYRQSDQPTKAIPILKTILEVNRSQLGEEHPKTIITMSNLALSYLDSGQAALGVPLIEDAYHQIVDVFGPNNQNSLVMQSNYGNVLIGAGRREEGKKLLLDRLARTQAIAKGDSTQWIPFAKRLAEKLAEQREYADEERILREVLTSQQESEAESWSTYHTQSLLGNCLYHQSQFAEAEQLLKTGFEGMERLQATGPADQDARRKEVAKQLQELYQAIGSKEEAEVWQKKIDALPTRD